MGKGLSNIGKAIVRNKRKIYTGLTITGTVATGVISGVAGVKIANDVAAKKTELGRDLNMKEKAAIAWKHCIPPVLVGGATVAAAMGEYKAAETAITAANALAANYATKYFEASTTWNAVKDSVANAQAQAIEGNVDATAQQVQPQRPVFMNKPRFRVYEEMSGQVLAGEDGLGITMEQLQMANVIANQTLIRDGELFLDSILLYLGGKQADRCIFWYLDKTDIYYGNRSSDGFVGTFIDFRPEFDEKNNWVVLRFGGVGPRTMGEIMDKTFDA